MQMQIATGTANKFQENLIKMSEENLLINFSASNSLKTKYFVILNGFRSTFRTNYTIAET